MVHSNIGYRCACLLVFLGLAIIAHNKSAHALVAGVSIDGYATASIQEASERQDARAKEETKRQEVLARRSKAVNIMVTLGYSAIDAKTFINALVKAGVI